MKQLGARALAATLMPLSIWLWLAPFAIFAAVQEDGSGLSASSHLDQAEKESGLPQEGRQERGEAAGDSDVAGDVKDGKVDEAGGSGEVVGEEAWQPRKAQVMVPRLSTTWTLFADYHGDNRNARDDDDHYADLRNIGYGELAMGPHSLGLRVDTATFFNPPDVRLIEGAGPPYANNYSLERFHYRYAGRRLTIQTGDFHKVFGRGLALSVRRVDELGVDVAIRGGLVEWQDDTYEITLLGGITNSVDLEPSEERLIADSCTDSFQNSSCNPIRAYPADTILGVRAARRFLGGAAGKGGMHYVHMRLTDPDQPDKLEPRAIVGASWELPDLGGFEFNVEGNRLFRYESVPFESGGGADVAEDDNGYALYGQAAGKVGPFIVLMEGRAYEAYHVGTQKTIDNRRYSTMGRVFHYQEPPSLERPDILVHNNVDARAARLRVDYPIPQMPVRLYISALMGQAMGMMDGAKTPIFHGWAGFDGKIGRNTLRLSGGRRTENLPNLQEELRHIEGYVSLPIVGVHSISVQGKHEDWIITGFQESDFGRGTWSLTYSMPPTLSLAYLFSYDTEVAEKYNQNLRQMEEVARYFHGAQLAIRPTAMVSGKIFAGSMRGGLQCVAGVCRTYPPFTGVRAELVFRY